MDLNAMIQSAVAEAIAKAVSGAVSNTTASIVPTPSVPRESAFSRPEPRTRLEHSPSVQQGTNLPIGGGYWVQISKGGAVTLGHPDLNKNTTLLPDMLRAIVSQAALLNGWLDKTGPLQCRRPQR